jgi:preprotein translocase subunit SecA
MFEALLNTINVEIVKALSSVTINENTSANDVEQQNNDDIFINLPQVCQRGVPRLA